MKSTATSLLRNGMLRLQGGLAAHHLGGGTTAEPSLLHKGRPLSSNYRSSDFITKTSSSVVKQKRFLHISPYCQSRLTQSDPKYEELSPSFQDGNNFSGMSTEFPCLLKHARSGPEPSYDKIVSGYNTFHFNEPFYMKYHNNMLPELQIAYETWGELNRDKSNAILVHAGL